MRSVVELEPEPHGAASPQPAYRLEVRDCFHCWRDLHVYVPVGTTLGRVVTGVPCPHCHRWEAETLIPEISQPVMVRACQRTWMGWQTKRATRWLMMIRAYSRIAARWPYWALYRLQQRASATNASREQGK